MNETSKQIEITREKLLIVEGKDDKQFFEALLKQMRIKDVQVIKLGGQNILKKYLRTFIKTSGFEKVKQLAICIDADKNPESKFRSICDSLKRLGFKPPSNPSTFHSTREKESLNIGIFLIPGQDKKGAIEDLCLETVSNDIRMSCVDKYINCLEKNNIEIRNESKCKVQVFLATEYETNSLGLAAQKSIWNFQSSSLNELKRFLEEFKDKLN
ncbi:MAG: DUF3226 domain-containing protein [Candidatus Heimdallarchaeaceae archaeon]